MKTKAAELQAARGAHRLTSLRCDDLERRLLAIRAVLTEQAYVKGCGEAGQLWADVDAVLRRVDRGGLF